MFVNRNQLSVLVALLGLSALVGCAQRDLRPLNPCTINGVSIRVPVTNVDKVDLLFMIDNSGSMEEEQDSLRRKIPRLVTTLASGITSDGRMFPAVNDLRVGIVSSDMGAGGNINSCAGPFLGDDGVLNRAAGGVAGCVDIGAGAPPFLGFRDGSGDAASFGAQVACIANLGTQGCGFEQQLDPVLKSVTPAGGTFADGSPVLFHDGTRGHGDGANEGFLRDDSLLAIIMLTDEDDCSAVEPEELFNTDSTVLQEQHANLRCSRFGDPSQGVIHPFQRYVDGLLAVRPPERLVFGAIIGIPEDLVDDAAAGNWDVLVGDESVRDPRMIEVPDPAQMNTQLTPTCSVPGRGVAYPGLRIARVARDLEAADASAVVQSICQDDYGPALDAIIDKIAIALNATCLPRPLNQDAEGRVTCNVVEVLPASGDITRCDQLADRGRVFREVNSDGREVCTVCQTDAAGFNIDTDPACLGAATGWWYETAESTPTGALDSCPPDRAQRVTFRDDALPVAGSRIDLECLQTAGSGTEAVTVGTGCGGDNAGICSTSPLILGATETPLACDPATLTCQVECTNTAQCVAAGLGGYVCFDADADGPGLSVCANPTCTTN